MKGPRVEARQTGSGRFISVPAKTILLLLGQQENLVAALSDYLGASGYGVVSCTSPESAIRRFRQLDGAVALIVTDVSDGLSKRAETAAELQMRSGGELKLLYISSRPLSEWNLSNTALYKRSPDSARVLQTPFSVLELLTRVSELIGSAEKTIERRASA